MPRTRVKLGTYNVNNLFDRFDDPYNFRDDFWGPNKTLPKKLKEVYALAHRILEDDPDILAFQEVENKGVLREFNIGHLGNIFLQRSIILVEANDPRSIDLAVGSKLPIGEVITHQYRKEGNNEIFSRDLLQVKILKEDTSESYLTLFVTHLKSKYVDKRNKTAEEIEDQRDKDNKRRKLQATTIAKIIKEQFDDPNQEAYAVVGDFNDTPDSDYLTPLLDNSNLDLHNIVEELPENQRWTYKFDEVPYQYDYILLSPPLRQKIITGTIDIIHRNHTTGSDHKPVYVELEYP